LTILEMSAGGSLLIAVILLLRRAALFRLPKFCPPDSACTPGRPGLPKRWNKRPPGQLKNRQQ